MPIIKKKQSVLALQTESIFVLKTDRRNVWAKQWNGLWCVDLEEDEILQDIPLGNVTCLVEKNRIYVCNSRKAKRRKRIFFSLSSE